MRFVMDVSEIVKQLGGSGSRSGGGSRDLSSAVNRLLFFVLRSVDGDLDSNGTTGNLFSVEGVDRLLLVFLGADVDEAVSLALPGITPAATDNAGRSDVDAGFGEQSFEAIIVDAEAKVGDKEHVLGGFACRVLASGTGWSRCTGLTSTRRLLGRSISGFSCSGSGLGSSFALSRGGSSLLLALEKHDLARGEGLALTSAASTQYTETS